MSTIIHLYKKIETINVPNVATWLGFYPPKEMNHICFIIWWKLFWKTITQKIA